MFSVRKVSIHRASLQVGSPPGTLLLPFMSQHTSNANRFSLFPLLSAQRSQLQANKSWDTGSYKGAPRGLSCGHCISSPGVGPDQTSHSRQSRGFAPLGFSQNTQPFHWLERLTRNRAGAACSTHWPALATTAWLLAPAQGRPCPCHSCTVLPAEAKGLGGCKHLRSFKYHWKIYKYTDITYLTSVALEFPYTWLCF